MSRRAHRWLDPWRGLGGLGLVGGLALAGCAAGAAAPLGGSAPPAASRPRLATPADMDRHAPQGLELGRHPVGRVPLGEPPRFRPDRGDHRDDPEPLQSSAFQ